MQAVCNIFYQHGHTANIDWNCKSSHAVKWVIRHFLWIVSTFCWYRLVSIPCFCLYFIQWFVILDFRCCFYIMTCWLYNHINFIVNISTTVYCVNSYNFFSELDMEQSNNFDCVFGQTDLNDDFSASFTSRKMAFSLFLILFICILYIYITQYITTLFIIFLIFISPIKL